MFVIGTVAGPRDKRVVSWAEHWTKRGQLLVLVQAGPEWLLSDTAAELRKAAPDIEIIPVTPTGNADIHWNSLIAIADMFQPEAVVTCKGTDEFMTDASWRLLKKAVRSDNDGRIWWVSYKDYFDGVHLPEMQNGPDYHPILLRGQPLNYPPRFHTWPSPQCSTDEIRFLPETIQIEHRRSLEDTVRANMERTAFGTLQNIETQGQFLQKLQAAATKAGLVWPVVEQEQK